MKQILLIPNGSPGKDKVLILNDVKSWRYCIIFYSKVNLYIIVIVTYYQHNSYFEHVRNSLVPKTIRNIFFKMLSETQT